MKTTQKRSKASGRKIMFLAGMAAMALTFGLVVMGCGGDDGGGGTPTDGDAVLPASSGENALSGKTYFEQDRKTIFAATESDATSGTYKVWSTIGTETGFEVDSNNKYKYAETENGTYSWDETAEKVTLKPEKVAEREGGNKPWGPLMDRAAYRTHWENKLNEWKLEDEAAFNAELESMGFSSAAEYVNEAVKRTFANKTDGYAFSTDNAALFLSEALPANKGTTNELNGQEFTNTDDSSRRVTFTSATEYSVKNGGTVIETGEYGYDTSDVKPNKGTQVYLKPLKKDNKTVAEYYSTYTVTTFEYYESEVAAKAADVNSKFKITDSRYKLSPNTISY